MTATDLTMRLRQLFLERLEAKALALGGCQAYMSDLEDEIAECRAALVLAAVTEIAVLRGELFGRDDG
jgi:hypothetical protein